MHPVSNADIVRHQPRFRAYEAQLERLKVIQNEAMRAILGCTRDTTAETMRYLLGFLTMTFLDSQM